MTRRWVVLTVPEEVLRKMTRAEYYEVQSWLRRVARLVEANTPEVHDWRYSVKAK